MEKNAKIIIKKNLDVTELAGEKVMIDFETGKYFLIKGVGNDIWDLIQKETTPDEIIKALLAEYEVSEEVCTSEVMAFLGKLEEYDFV